MNVGKGEWVELEATFRVTATKWCESVVALHGGASTREREHQLLAAAESPELFRRTWRQIFNVESILLAQDFKEESALFRSRLSLLRDSLRVTRAEIKVSNELLKKNGPTFRIEAGAQEDAYLDEVFRRASRRRSSLVIDHAGYALYVAWQPDALVVVPDNRRDLLRAIAIDPGALTITSPRRFEELIAYLYESLGCHVQLTQQTRDYGADILVWHPAPLGSRQLIVVQVKRYSPHRRVGIKEIFELHGAVTHYHASTGHIVTTSDFTGPARRFAENIGYNLVNCRRLQEEILNL